MAVKQMMTSLRAILPTARLTCRRSAILSFLAMLIAFAVASPKLAHCALPDTSMTSDEETKSGWPRHLGAGMRWEISISDEKHEYIEQRLASLQADAQIPGSWGAIIALLIGYRSVSTEFEFGIHGEKADFYGGTHEVLAQNMYGNLWLRWRWSKPFNLPIYLCPGVAIGYTSAELYLYLKSEVTDSELPSDSKLMEGSGTTSSLGVILELGRIPGAALAMDYRYRFGRLTDVETLNDGIGLLSGSPKFDCSGHTIAFGFVLYFQK